ncbi:MAG TPA: Co2+/Mg2+ efflux protein ApaG [Xanthomonadales bacterium]|nr:Co2+/Mg2+ efflux protein ApaG [Xanthomonadales bacterium]
MDVEVKPHPTYLGQHEGRYAFAYRITITNHSAETVKLLNRHWIITHGDGGVEEVKGEGVVGEQPRLTPGESHTYSSGAMIPTPSGSMKGSYEFITDSGDMFQAEIPEFVLAAPESLH